MRTLNRSTRYAPRGRLSIALLVAFISVVGGMTPEKTGATGAAVSFVGTWTPNTGVGWTITSQSPSGACAGYSALSQFTLTGCSVSGSAYRFTVAQKGTSYSSRNTGVITGDTLVGSFTDTNGTTIGYTATRKPTGVTLSGTVRGQTCSPTQCTSAGLPSQSIVVNGTTTEGAAVSKSTDSATSGAWSVSVKAGSYTVGPSSDGVTLDGSAFTPPQIHVTAANKDVANLDFIACVASEEAPGRQVGTVHTAGVTAAPARSGPGSCPPDHIDWTMPSETADVPTKAGATVDGLLPTRTIYNPLRADLFLTRFGQKYTACSPKTVWTWTVTPRVRSGKVVGKLPDPLIGCTVTILVNTSGVYHVQAREVAAGGTKPLHTLTEDVAIRDVLLLAMGDSNGSGEGYPPFYFDQCHRGVASYQYQAAQLLEEQAAHHATVTFVSTSCSGARTQHLVDTPYDGIVPGVPQRPQISRLTQQLTPPGGDAARSPDALLVSIGVNNIAFGPILLYCAKTFNKAKVHHPFALPSYCEDSPVNAPGDGTGGVKEFTVDLHGSKTLGTTIDHLIAQLPDRYDEVARALSASGLVKPSAVYINQYPQFWFDSATTLCGGVSSLFPTQTWAWLASEGNKLNAAVAAAAARHHWTLITVPASAFYEHGYCRFSGSWFVPVSLSLHYNKDGAFHPTARGAHVTAVQALRLLCPLLDDKKKCTSFPTP